MGLGPHFSDLISYNDLQKALSPNTYILTVRASTYEFAGDTIQSIA